MGGGEGPSPAPEQIIIDESFENNKCVMGVYNKLGGTDFAKKYLTKFDNKLRVPNLTWKVVSIPPTSEGTLHGRISRVENEEGQYAIEINELASKYPLELASTMIHELIHATLFRYVDSVPEKQIPESFPGIFDYFVRYKHDFHHEQMAQHYVNIMIDALKEIDKSYSYDYYEALAWDGLQGTTAYNNLSQAKKDKLKKDKLKFKQDATKTKCS